MNGTCHSSEPTWPSWVKNVVDAYVGLLLALGLLLNGLALWAFCCRVRRWTETHIYVASLAVADLCLLCALPFFLHSLKQRTEDTLFCQLSQGVYPTNGYMSISLVTAVAADRYVAPPSAPRGRPWPCARRSGRCCCFPGVSRQSSNTAAFSPLGFCLPLAVLPLCSLQVVAALGQGPAAHTDQAEATRRATRMVWANLVVFVACFLPLHVVLAVRVAASRSAPTPPSATPSPSPASSQMPTAAWTPSATTSRPRSSRRRRRHWPPRPLPRPTGAGTLSL
ncbi:G-protein coupled receptor 35 isoform X2 [Prionailurus iriomotensis]